MSIKNSVYLKKQEYLFPSLRASTASPCAFVIRAAFLITVQSNGTFNLPDLMSTLVLSLRFTMVLTLLFAKSLSVEHKFEIIIKFYETSNISYF